MDGRRGRSLEFRLTLSRKQKDNDRSLSRATECSQTVLYLCNLILHELQLTGIVGKLIR